MTKSKKLLKKLTPEQEALIPVVRDEWISLSLNSGNKVVQEHEIREGIDWLCKTLELSEHPRILTFDSNLGMELELDNLLARSFKNFSGASSIKDSVNSFMKDCDADEYSYKALSNYAYHSHSKLLKQIDNSVHGYISTQVWFLLSIVDFSVENLRGPLWNSVVRSMLKNPKFISGYLRLYSGLYRDGYIGLANDAGKLSSYDYYSRAGIISDDHEKNFFNVLSDIVRAGIWTMCYYKGSVLVCRLPTKVSRDEQGRLHSMRGPAVQWRDGSGQYFIHGVSFSQSLEEHTSEPELWRKMICSSKDLSLKEIVRISNMEQRYLAFKLLGAEKLLREARAQLIDKSKRGNELYKIEDDMLIERDSRPLKLLKYKDLSTDRIYVSFVPYEYEKADAAMAWKFQLSEEEYKLLKTEA